MKTNTLLALALAILALPRSLQAQGPLTPPSAPGPTMKTLQELWYELQTLKANDVSQQQQIMTLQKDSRRVRAPARGCRHCAPVAEPSNQRRPEIRRALCENWPIQPSRSSVEGKRPWRCVERVVEDFSLNSMSV